MSGTRLCPGAGRPEGRGSPAARAPRLDRPTCGRNASARTTIVAPSLSILQQLPCREERVKRITLRDQFRAAFFAIYHTKCCDNLVSCFFGSIRSVEDRI